MTQRVARPMKFAAFISIIVSVAVMFVACQGAVGPEGPKGDKGDPGADGASGTDGATGPIGPTGATGPGAFQGRSGVDASLFNDEELKTGALALAANGTSNVLTVNVASHFVGGVGPYEYKLVDAFFVDNADGSTADVVEVIEEELDKDSGDLTFKLVAPASGAPGNLFEADAYTQGFKITVMGTDSNGVTAESVVTVGLNRAPRLKGADTARDNSFVLGTQAADRETPLTAAPGLNAECTKINECVLDVFEDDDDITITVEGMTVQGNADSTKVSAVVSDTDVTVTGMASTWIAADPDADPPVDAGFRAVRISLKATDSKGLDTETAVLVDVDAAPTLSDLGMNIRGTTYTVEGTYTLTTGDGTAFFQDDTPTGSTIAVTAAPGNAAIATVATTAGIVISGVTAGQSTTIKLTATESGATADLGQTAELEFTVNVTEGA